MTTVTGGRKRPVVAALYREALPPRLAEVEELAEVRHPFSAALKPRTPRAPAGCSRSNAGSTGSPARSRGQSALVVGTGSIGREISRLFRAVGMEVDGAGRHSRPGVEDFDQIHSSRELAAVVHDYDCVVLAAPVTTHTTGLVGVEVLTAMKPSARLIKLERGQLVDTAALTDALTSGTNAGAALDVVHSEPLPEGHPLWSLENVIITPHMSGDTEDYPDDLGQLFVRRVGKRRVTDDGEASKGNYVVETRTPSVEDGLQLA